MVSEGPRYFTLPFQCATLRSSYNHSLQPISIISLSQTTCKASTFNTFSFMPPLYMQQFNLTTGRSINWSGYFFQTNDYRLQIINTSYLSYDLSLQEFPLLDHYFTPPFQPTQFFSLANSLSLITIISNPCNKQKISKCHHPHIQNCCTLPTLPTFLPSLVTL